MPWEIVEEERRGSGDVRSQISLTQRLSVPGGWIYRSVYWAETGEVADTLGMVFVPLYTS